MSAQDSGEIGQVASFQAISHQNVGQNIVYSSANPCADKTCAICHVEVSQSETETALSHVENNAPSTREYMLGGITGKGFLPGVCPNPGGRPKKRPISDLYEEILNDPENLKLFRQSVIKAVASGRMASMFQLKEMADRVEGKVTQPVEMSGEIALAVSDRVSRARERARLVPNGNSNTLDGSGNVDNGNK